MTNLRKRKKYMFHFDDQSPQKYIAECEDRIHDRPHAGTLERASNRETALGKRERERARERFLLCDSSRSLESLHFTLVGWETRKRKATYQILKTASSNMAKVSLSLSLSLCVRERERERCKNVKSSVKAH